MTLIGLLPLVTPGASRVGSLMRAEVPWPASTTCELVDGYFRSDPGRTSLLVHDPELPTTIGMVSRGPFLLAMAGRYGFGRALFARSPVSDLARWDQDLLSADASVQQAVTVMLARDPGSRHDDLVVRTAEGGWGLLSAASVLEALSCELAAQATTDSLTGLASRGRLLGELTQRHAVPHQGARTVLLFVDLDRFKQVNDVYGHNAGDAVLVEVARRLRSAARPGDLIARLGGDEFVLLLTMPPDQAHEPEQLARDIAQRVLATITEPIVVGSATLFVGASVGVAVSSRTGSDPQTLLREADLAMYTAKRAGGDRIELVGSVGTELAQPLGLAINDTLRRALRAGEFVLHYQPIRRLSENNRVVSVEALIRWHDPTHGMRGPGEFLPAAEASGLIVDIDRWVLGEACRQLRAWDADPRVTAPWSLNVNVSQPHLAHPGLADHVLDALADSGLEPGRLRLEIPETASLEDLRAAEPALSALRRAGVQLTLDDLGSGSSTLRHLSSLPVDGIKIDRSFISNLHKDTDRAVVKLLIDLAHNLGIKVTAEGVETAEQLAALTALGCTAGQGYFLGRPVPVVPGDEPDWLLVTHPALAAGP